MIGELRVETCASAGQKTKTRCVGGDLYRDLYAVTQKYGMKSWTDLPQSELIAMDAPSTSVSILFRDGTVISISSSDELPKTAGTASARSLNCWKAQ